VLVDISVRVVVLLEPGLMLLFDVATTPGMMVVGVMGYEGRRG
jgi:hypothetical protein